MNKVDTKLPKYNEVRSEDKVSNTSHIIPTKKAYVAPLSWKKNRTKLI